MENNTENSRWFYEMAPKVSVMENFVLFIFYSELSDFFFCFSAYPVNTLQNPIGFHAFSESTQPDGLRRGIETDVQTYSNLCGYETLRLLLFHTESDIAYRM